MATMLTIPITKGKGTIEIDVDALPDAVFKELLILGAKVVLNRS